MNRVEYNKQRNYEVSVVKFHLVYVFYFLKITAPLSGLSVVWRILINVIRN